MKHKVIDLNMFAVSGKLPSVHKISQVVNVFLQLLRDNFMQHILHLTPFVLRAFTNSSNFCVSLMNSLYAGH